MYKCPNKNFPEWKELERVVPEVAYTIWDMNNGHGIDKAPNGEPSILFNTLLEHYNNDREQAIKTKSKIYSSEFLNWFGNWFTGDKTRLTVNNNLSIDFLFDTNPEISNIGSKEEYQQYLETIFPNTLVKDVYWHGTDSDFSDGLNTAKRGKGSGAPETGSEMYFNKLPWASLQYISGVNRNIPDVEGFNNWVKLWWELKEALGNGRMDTNDWKNEIIGQNTRQYSPNKRGLFDKDKGGTHGKYLSERKARYGYENKSDKEFFEEVFDIKYGEETFAEWVNRKSEEFKLLWNDRSVKHGIFPAILNIKNPIIEENLNTYYEELRGLFTKAKQNNNDAILSNRANNEFGSDVAIVFNPKDNVHFLGTRSDLQLFLEWKRLNNKTNVSKVVDKNGEPLVVYHGTSKRNFGFNIVDFNKLDDKISFFTTDNIKMGRSYTDKLELETNDNVFSDPSQYPYEYISFDDEINAFRLPGENLFGEYDMYGNFTYAEEITNEDIVRLIEQKILYIGSIVTEPYVSAEYKGDALKKVGIYSLSSLDLKVKKLKSDLEFFKERKFTLRVNNGNEIYKLFMDIKNPLYINDGINYVQVWNSIYVDNHDIIPKGKYKTRDLTRLAKELGYDGVIFRKIFDFGPNANDEDMYEYESVFRGDGYVTRRVKKYGDLFVAIDNPNQVKSISNEGGFSTQDNNIYHKEGTTLKLHKNTNATLLNQLGEFADTTDVANFLIKQEEVKGITVTLLNKLNAVNRPFIIRQGSKGKTRASAGNAVYFYSDIVNNSSILDIAEDFAHEMLHIYLRKEYDLNVEFKNNLDSLQRKYRDKLGTDWYGLGINQTSDELLNEFLSNTAFRDALRNSDKNIFQRIWTIIKGIVNKLLFNKSTDTMPKDLQELQEYAFKLLDRVNQGEISIYSSQEFVETYSTDTFNKLDANQLLLVDKLYEKVLKGIKDRLNAIKRYSSKNPKVWRDLLNLIQKLSTSESEQGIIQFIEHVRDSIKDSNDFLSKHIEEINAKQIRQLSNDYVGFYKPLIDDIKYLVDTTDIFKELEEYDDINNLVYQMSSSIDTVNNKFINVLKSKGYLQLTQYLRQNGMPEEFIQNTIAWLDDPKHDSSIFMNWFGMSSNSDNAIQQAIAKMLNDAKNATDRLTLDVGIKLIKILNKAKDKYGNDVLKLIYERDENGDFTGYRVTKLNQGKFNREKKQYLDNIANMLGIIKDTEGMYVLPEDPDILKKWFDSINKWYGKHANRKYKSEYYDLRNKMLSLKTRDAQDEIQGYINSIVNPITIDGIEYDNLLSEAEFNQLQLLRKQKRLLANPYNLDGSMKTGDDAIIAEELTKFNEKVNEKVRYTSDLLKYQADRNKVAKRYGEGSELLKLWEKRNTVERYNQAFYDRIDSLEKAYQTKAYKELVKRRRSLLALFKDPITGKINIDAISDTEKRLLIQLDQDIADEYTHNLEINKEGPKLSDFAEVVTVDLYYTDMEKARNSGKQAYDEWFAVSHYEDSIGFLKPARYYTELKPLDEYMDMYVEVVPSSRYSTLEPNSEWYNSEWDPNGPAIQPNKQYYDNSKAYNQMASKPEVKQLYDAIEEVMDEANKYISFMQFANDYRMPLIPARFMQALYRKDGLLGKLNYALEDFATTKDDDLDFVKEFSTMPNGDPIKVIPTRFIKMLDDPNIISTDAVAAVVQYYNMAANYHNMSQQQDDIELMLNLLKQVNIRNRKENKAQGSSNIYKQSQLLVDRLMYGKNKSPLLANVFGKEINVGKALDIIRTFVTKVNLSGNLWSIGTGFFTDATYTTLEAKMGRFFDMEDLHYAQTEFLRELPNMLSNIGNPDPKGKLPYLLDLNQVVKDNLELFDRLDLSQVLRSINQNFWFAGYTLADYTVKSHTLLSIYHNYRFVEGAGFLSKKQYIDKYYPNDSKKGSVNFKLLKTTLYDAYVTDKDGNTKVDAKYEKYVTEKLLNDVKNRIQILTKRIDGTIREVDKALIHANSIAAYTVMHRNFMITALHDRFKKRLYNLDLGVIEEGYYRVTGRFLQNVIGNRHFALTQLLADYNNMQEYELYAVRRVMNELLLVAGSTAVAITLASLVDGDDDYDMWLTQSVTYLAMRSAFEFRTMYNPFELISLIKSPTAAFNWIDNISSFINLFNPFAYAGNKTPFTIIDRGVYKGMPVILRNVIKVTPFKNVFEAQDPKSKRSYLLNLLMNF